MNTPPGRRVLLALGAEDQLPQWWHEERHLRWLLERLELL